RVVPPLAAWRQATVGTFLAAYSARMQGCVAHPGNDATMQALLRLFVLEKTLYELRYELDNRIDWVRIPLAGLTQQLLELERR
ncbi:MAG: hypothetical protein ACHP91_05960, partial [Burkholderiales bacterium]